MNEENAFLLLGMGTEGHLPSLFFADSFLEIHSFNDSSVWKYL